MRTIDVKALSWFLSFVFNFLFLSFLSSNFYVLENFEDLSLWDWEHYLNSCDRIYFTFDFFGSKTFFNFSYMTNKYYANYSRSRYPTSREMLPWQHHQYTQDTLLNRRTFHSLMGMMSKLDIIDRLLIWNSILIVNNAIGTNYFTTFLYTVDRCGKFLLVLIWVYH